MWRFWLDTVEVEEPQKWDSVQFSLRRSDALGGLEYLFSDSLDFTGRGAEYLQAKFNAEGIDAGVAVRIEKYDCEQLQYQYNGRVNFSIYKENNGCSDCTPETVTVGLVQSGLTSRFKNLLDVPVNLDAAQGVSGNVLTPLGRRSVGLHSREIIYRSTYVINPALTRYSGYMDSSQTQISAVPPFQMVGGEVDQSMEPTDWGPTFDQPLFYSGFTYRPEIESRLLQVSGRVKVRVTYSEPVTVAARLNLVVVGVQSQVVTTDYLLASRLIGTGSLILDFPFSTPVSFPPDSNLIIFLEFRRVSGSSSVVFTVDWDTSVSALRYEEKTLYTHSNVEGFLVSEALSRITESITGERDSFRSEFFANGCGKWNLVTNGLAVRQARNTNNQFLPISTSFQDLYNGLDAIFCLGRRLELEGVPTPVLLNESFCVSVSDNTKYAALTLPVGYYEVVLSGTIPPNEAVRLSLFNSGVLVWEQFVSSIDPKQYRFQLAAVTDQFRLVSNISGCFGVTVQGIQHEVVRVEPREYFYRNEPVLTLENVADVDRSVDLQSIANEFEVGYTKWESGSSGGVDEVQSKRNYVLPLEQAKRKISAMSQLITGGYLIEQQRRKQFQQTTDAPNDNDLFLIALNQTPIQSDRYTVNRLLTNYGVGEVAERNEAFTDVTGLNSPETVYNLRLSPARMAYHWRRVLAVSTVKKLNPVAKFQSGTGNTQEGDQLLNGCEGVEERVSQAMNVPLTVTPLFQPEIYSFSAPLSLGEFLRLQQNAIFAVAFSCASQVSQGFIREVTYEPNDDGGTANFTLIKAPTA